MSAGNPFNKDLVITYKILILDHLGFYLSLCRLQAHTLELKTVKEKRLLALRIYYLHPLPVTLFIIWFQHLLVFF